MSEWKMSDFIKTTLHNYFLFHLYVWYNTLAVFFNLWNKQNGQEKQSMGHSKQSNLQWGGRSWWWLRPTSRRPPGCPFIGGVPSNSLLYLSSNAAPACFPQLDDEAPAVTPVLRVEMIEHRWGAAVVFCECVRSVHCIPIAVVFKNISTKDFVLPLNSGLMSLFYHSRKLHHSLSLNAILPPCGRRR